MKELVEKIGYEYMIDIDIFRINGEYYISTFSNTDTPVQYTINNNKGKVLIVLEDNKEQKEVLANQIMNKEKTIHPPCCNLNFHELK